MRYTVISNPLKFKELVRTFKQGEKLDLGELYKADNNLLLIENCYRTTNTWERLRGLIGRGFLSETTALLLDPSDCIHTFFMCNSIDVLYLDESLRIIKTVAELKPWKLSACLKATTVLVLSAGSAKKHNLSPRKKLVWALKHQVW